MKNVKTILVLGTVLSGLAVAIGAFGAHALEPLLEQNQRADTFETASKYHFYHALGILLLGAFANRFSPVLLKRAAWLMAAGVLVFSGSLYLLSVTNIGWLGAITPVGGVLFIVAWAMAGWSATRSHAG